MHIFSRGDGFCHWVVLVGRRIIGNRESWLRVDGGRRLWSFVQHPIGIGYTVVHTSPDLARNVSCCPNPVSRLGFYGRSA